MSLLTILEHKQGKNLSSVPSLMRGFLKEVPLLAI